MRNVLSINKSFILLITLMNILFEWSDIYHKIFDKILFFFFWCQIYFDKVSAASNFNNQQLIVKWALVLRICDFIIHIGQNMNDTSENNWTKWSMTKK